MVRPVESKRKKHTHHCQLLIEASVACRAFLQHQFVRRPSSSCRSSLWPPSNAPQSTAPSSILESSPPQPLLICKPSLSSRSCPDASRIAIEFRDGRWRPLGAAHDHRGLSEPRRACQWLILPPVGACPCWSIGRDSKMGLGRINCSINRPADRVLWID